MFDLKAWIGKKPTPRREGYVRVGTVEDFPLHSARVVVAFGRDIGLFHVEDGFRAVDNICPHSNRPIGTIDYDGVFVTCIWHGLRFRFDSGVCPEAPHYRVATYPVVVEGGDVMIGPPEDGGPDPTMRKESRG